MITTRLHQVLVDINMTFFWTESLDHGVLFRFKLASLTIRTYRTGTLDRWVNMYIGCIFYSAFLKIKNISVLMLMIMMAASAMNRHFFNSHDSSKTLKSSGCNHGSADSEWHSSFSNRLGSFSSQSPQNHENSYKPSRYRILPWHLAARLEKMFPFIFNFTSYGSFE